ncbi:hypothetical protein, partial [uncultured Thiodictyon sp.]|uniref:hypothetical protein n=1 Tax=uncultured Thiodictyon sp. TaxID=1846217 RepID=UPI0025E5170D
TNYARPRAGRRSRLHHAPSSKVNLMSRPPGCSRALSRTQSDTLKGLVPALEGTLAAQRQQERVRKAIEDIGESLQEYESKLQEISDEQYALLNEIYLAVLQTTSEEKIAFLKIAVKNALEVQDSGAQETIALSRAIRDISAEEVAFLMRTFYFSDISMSPPSEKNAQDRSYHVAPDGPEAIYAAGLVSLGILFPGELVFSGGTTLRFSRITARLLALLKDS